MSHVSLYNALRAKREADGDNRDFTIESKWIQSTRVTWPPPVSEKQLAVDDKEVIDTLLVEVGEGDWRWSETQYTDETWLKPKIRTYRLRFDKDTKLHVQTSCEKRKGSYQVTKDLLSIAINKPPSLLEQLEKSA